MQVQVPEEQVQVEPAEWVWAECQEWVVQCLQAWEVKGQQVVVSHVQAQFKSLRRRWRPSRD